MRDYLFQRCELEKARSVLDVGCGTGVLLKELEGHTTRRLYGLDIERGHLIQASAHVPGADLIHGDAHCLPYPSNTFDASLCHFVLLWVHDPLMMISEMVRVTRPRGAVLALAEPDYGGRIDYPPELAQLSTWQQAALRAQGADPELGRRLKAIFTSAGLESLECGIIGARWVDPVAREEWESEWAVIENDIRFIQEACVEYQNLEYLKRIDQAAWTSHQRILFVPTFFAWGRVPSGGL